VHKFGGVSLTDGAAMRRVGAILAERVPDRPVAVVSAIEGVTNALDLAARAAQEGRDELGPVRIRHRSLLAQLALDPEMLNRHFAELATVLGAIRARKHLTALERDHVLSFGERASARLVAAHLNDRGLRAVPIDAYDLGLVSDSNHGRAKVLAQSAERVRSALERFDGIPVITGFVAADAHGRLTTLGRNGSDLSAALIGEAIGAREVCFWKEVGGVMTADPKLVPSARVLRTISYSDAARLTSHGAGVLHADAIAPLERASIHGRVACVRRPEDEGTLMSRAESSTRAIACRRGVSIARIARQVGSGNPEVVVLAGLERSGVEMLHLELAGDEVLVVAPWSDELGRALLQLGLRLSIERDLATLAMLGAHRPGDLEGALRASAIDVRAAWSEDGGATQVAAVDAEQLASAAQAVHQFFCEVQAT
jgi:aspartate kinase